jgi:hypothetical protein
MAAKTEPKKPKLNVKIDVTADMETGSMTVATSVTELGDQPQGPHHDLHYSKNTIPAGESDLTTILQQVGKTVEIALQMHGEKYGS